MGRLYRWLLCMAACLALSMLLTRAIYAQAAVSPLYVELGDSTTGDIFSYTPARLKNLTSYGYNTIPVLSPDSKYIAYGSYAKTYVEEDGRSGAPAMNIWLMETLTGNAKRVADQGLSANKASIGESPQPAGDERVPG